MSMLTRWGKAIDSENVLQEYPRPQMVRESYINLNGYWDYAITDDSLEHMSDTADGKILVPFSPEAPLSGVGRSLLPDQKLWYRRVINLNRQAQSRLLLHFGAVDQCASVYINNSFVCDHVGGYTAFEVDITDFISDGENVLTVMVTDGTDSNELSRGKQKTKRGGIWYTPQSGIWQTVWMEWVPEKYIKSLRITPAPELNSVDIILCSDAAADCAIIFNGKRIEGRSNEPIHVPVDTPELCHPSRRSSMNLQLSLERIKSTAILLCAHSDGARMKKAIPACCSTESRIFIPEFWIRATGRTDYTQRRAMRPWYTTSR